MKETDQLKKLMESIDSTYRPVDEADVTVGDTDPMTGEIESMPENVFRVDWKTSPEDLLNMLSGELGNYGIIFKTYDDGSDDVVFEIKRVDN